MSPAPPETPAGTSIPGTPEGPSPSRADRAIALVRIGIGLVWTVNLLFILYPPNQFFPQFAATAQSFAPTTLGGPGIASFVATHSLVFSVAIAATTAYLAVGLLAGVTTRIACAVGFVFNTFLLVTQFGTILVIPGGTDVGPMPLYLVIYLGLLAYGGPTLWSVDRWWVRRRSTAPAPRQALLTDTPSRPVGSESYPMGSLGR
jgi:uncharacterized membrane protein YphA (DoxX/SURF4 family)